MSQPADNQYPPHIEPIITKYKTVGRAIKSNDAEAADTLLTWIKEEGLSLSYNLTAENISRLLWGFASSLNRKTVEVLVKHGADPDFRDYPADGPTPGNRKTHAVQRSVSDLAIMKGNIELVQWFIDNGRLTPDTTDGNGNSLFQNCIEGGALDLADWLLSRGANINHQNLAELSAMHRAASEGDAIGVVFLLQRGAKANLLSVDNAAPQELVPESNPNPMIAMMQEKDSALPLNDLYELLVEAFQAHEAQQSFEVPAEIVQRVGEAYRKATKQPFPEYQPGPAKVSIRM